MIFVSLVVAGVAAATGLVIAAMGENMLYFYSPSQVIPTSARVASGKPALPGDGAHGILCSVSHDERLGAS